MKNLIQSNSIYHNHNRNAINSMTVGIQNFQKFLQQLLNAGANPDVIIKLRNYVRLELGKGNDPQFIPSTNGLYVDKRYFGFFSGLNGEADQLADSLASSSGDPTLMIVSQLIDFDKVLGNFSAIFSNGFDLSCWGASYSESEAKKDMEIDFPYMLEVSGINNVNEESINRFSALIDTYIGSSKWVSSRSKFAKCTRKGHKFRMEKSIEFKNSIFDKIRSNPSITITSLGTSLGPSGLVYKSANKGKPFKPRQITRYSVTINDIDSQQINIDSLPIINNNQPIINDNNQKKPKVNQAGFNGLPLAFFGLGLVGLLLLNANKSETIKEN